MRHLDDYPKHEDRPTVALDFDGVLNTYTGWAGPKDLYGPRPDARSLLEGITGLGYRVVIHTTRPPHLVHEWLGKHSLTQWVAEVMNVKPPAVAYVDDRAVRFDGEVQPVLDELETFRTHWEREEEVEQKPAAD